MSPHQDDLKLAARCAQGDQAALAELEETVLRPAEVWLSRRFGAQRAEEAVQHTRSRLVVAAPGRPPLISTFTGRGPLGAWVRTIALRTAIQSAEAEASLGSPDADEDAALAVDPHIEAHFRRYRPHFDAAFRVALKRLSRKERVALRMSVIDGLPLEKIAAVFHVHPSSVSRWLTQARASLRENTCLALQASLGLGAVSAQSIIGRLGGTWDESLATWLRG